MESTIDNQIAYYYRCYDLQLFKYDKTVLRQLFLKFVTPKHSSSAVSISTYFKPKRLSSQFSLRPRRSESESHGLVYQFDCPIEDCCASYIGYTTNALSTRANQHRYKSSKIHSHYTIDHQLDPPKNILESFHIRYRNSFKKYIEIAEALLIRKEKPLINVRYNELATGLNVFK